MRTKKELMNMEYFFWNFSVVLGEGSVLGTIIKQC